MKTLTKKKNFLLLGAGVLSLAVAGSVGAISASAAEITQASPTGSTTVTYEVAETWTVNTPDTLTVGGEAGSIKAVGTLNEGNTLEVTATSGNNWKVGGVSYKLTCDGKEATKDNDVVCSFTAAELKTAADTGVTKSDLKAELVEAADGYAHSSASDTITWHIESKSATV